MSITVSEQFQEVEAQRAAVEKRVEALNEDQFRWSPAADVWSAGEIVEHLVRSDEFVGSPVDKRQVKNEAWMLRLVPRGVRRAFLVRSFSRDRALPMVISELAPAGGAARDELFRRWSAARSGMRSDLEGGTDDLRYYHRILGPMTLAQVLEVGSAHTAYHTRQLEALLRHERFPKS